MVFMTEKDEEVVNFGFNIEPYETLASILSKTF